MYINHIDDMHIHKYRYDLTTYFANVLSSSLHFKVEWKNGPKNCWKCHIMADLLLEGLI